LNPHGINMAVLWISGRTSLFLVFFATLAARSSVRGRHVTAGVFCFLALLSKEEAVLLPVALAAWAYIRAHEEGRTRQVFRASLPAFAALAIYFVLRADTNAMTPATAPDFYRPSLDVGLLLRNIAEYTDRVATFPAAVLLLTGIAARRMPRLLPPETTIVGLGLAWAVLGYGLTVFLPVRSSLYACYPLVGTSLAAAVAIGAVHRRATPAAHRRMVIAALVATVAVVPLWRRRNVRWVRAAQLSTATLAQLRQTATTLEPSQHIVLHDAPGMQRPRLDDAFGGLMPEAGSLCTSLTPARVFVDPTPAGWTQTGAPPTNAVHLRVEGVAVRPVNHER
jgi:hypothetical protein